MNGSPACISVNTPVIQPASFKSQFYLFFLGFSQFMIKCLIRISQFCLLSVSQKKCQEKKAPKDFFAILIQINIYQAFMKVSSSTGSVYVCMYVRIHTHTHINHCIQPSQMLYKVHIIMHTLQTEKIMNTENT